MRPLRILHSEAATGMGGQEQYILRMMNAMRERGHSLELVCQPGAPLGGRVREAGFVVHETPMDPPMNFLRSIGVVRGILRRGKFDVLNCHSRRDTLVAGLGGRLAGTPLIVRTRHLASKVGSMLSYTVIPHRVTAASDYVSDYLVSRGVPRAHVATVYPAVDLQPRPAGSTLRTELGLGSDDIIVGCVAVMRFQKGHKELLDAMEPIVRARPNVHLVIVGGGSQAVVDAVKAHAYGLEIQDRVHFLGQRRDVPNLLEGFDIFALATRIEASGTAFVEAGAAGLPVVGTRVGGVPEMVRDGETGILVPLDDRQSLTEALMRLIDDPILRRQMGRAGLAYCRDGDRFGPDKMGERIEACYLRWLKERET
ncbi:glycosyltransferase family 1 protein [Allopusillimonas soli]|uniref:Glycosyltransferase family 4 protein n=1 Tax=Allopusillimonas soli TaxID=659016 RepID=A0A853FF08_9BURK|nr:glycosyltransferase family 4 protein [Allopusillimonas soli]NYT38469.1 glycosyltransferase family 4 protein [Allopusillimonas soli]TEA71977.1 glycosyltransferase family 1 protein [Allopusillimonas soli]